MMKPPLYDPLSFSSTTGVTLLEILLVLVIAASIMILSIQQYTQYKFDADTHSIQYNIDLIFQALSDFYQMHCGAYWSGNSNPPSLGELAKSSSLTSSPYPVNIKTQLVDTQLLKQPFIKNNFVNEALSNSYQGYLAQFNPKKIDRTVSTGSKSTKIGTIVTWLAQVAIQVRNNPTQLLEQYKNLLNATCLSTKSSNNAIEPCDNGHTGDYLVWERPPSFTATHANGLIPSPRPQQQQFNQLYSTYPILYLMESGNSDKQFFYCAN